MAKKIDYAALSSELDAIIANMESGDITIDKAMEQFERGVAITKELEAYLKSAENTVEKLKASFKT